MEPFYGALSSGPGVYLDPKVWIIGSNMSRYQRMRRYFRFSRIRNRSLSYPRQGAVPTAALAECTCPEFCERDHDND